MPAVLCSAVVTEFRLAFPDCDATQALVLLNRVHRNLQTMLPLKVTQEDINLTAGDYEYTVNTATIKIWTVDYLRSATNGKRMNAVDFEKYNRETPNWRISPQGEPSQYALWSSGSGFGIYVFPIPQETTSGGYPILRLDVSRTETLVAGDSTPATIESEDIYLTGMCARYARYRKRDEYDYWTKQYTAELKTERDVWDARAVETPPSVTPSWMPRSYVV